ncbi:MAG: FAD-dependent oxidoreductase, partial [bacterium]|nr:FAD-dependent oxidoreductase [bacterium]
MKILDNAIIKDHYEVIVVGAGIGGLTTAAMLAKRGVDVLLIEQHYMPGGCCAAIRRQDVTMDVGATVLYGFGEKGLNTHRFVMNELEEEIDMTPRESIYNMHVGDKNITFWLDFKRFFNELVGLFPGQKEELKKFYDHLYKLYEVVLASKMIVTPSAMTPADNLKMLMKAPVGT